VRKRELRGSVKERKEEIEGEREEDHR
jgi:hypothetical protein